jgi:hypothetical protein
MSTSPNRAVELSAVNRATNPEAIAAQSDRNRTCGLRLITVCGTCFAAVDLNRSTATGIRSACRRPAPAILSFVIGFRSHGLCAASISCDL